MFVTFLKYFATFAVTSAISFPAGILYYGGLDALKEVHEAHLRAFRRNFIEN